MPLPSVLIKLRAIFRSRWLAPWRLLCGLLLAATIWGLVDVRRRAYLLPEAPWQHKTDLTVYTEAGAAFFDGRPPYEVCNPRGWTYVYPPIFAMLLAPLHALPLHDQATVWFFLCLTMCWGAYRESARIIALVSKPGSRGAEAAARWAPWIGLIAAATVTLPTLNCLQRGQVTVVILYLMLLGLRLILAARTPLGRIAGGMVLALPVAIKIIPLLPIAFLLFVQLVGFLRKRWAREPTASLVGRQFASSSLGVGLGLLLFFFVIPAAMIGWNANLHHLDTWSHRVLGSASHGTATPGFEKPTHSVRNQCLGNALYRLGNFGAHALAGGPKTPMVDGDNPPPRLMDDPNVNACLLSARIALLLALLLVGVRLGVDKDSSLSQAAAFGLACAAMLVVSPVARNHYFMLLAPAVLFVPLWLDHLSRLRNVILLAMLPGVLITLQFFFMPYVGRIGLLGLGTAGWFIGAMVLIDRAARSGRDAGILQDTSDAPPTAPLVKAA